MEYSEEFKKVHARTMRWKAYAENDRKIKDLLFLLDLIKYLMDTIGRLRDNNKDLRAELAQTKRAHEEERIARRTFQP